jgi:hypothetical protein
MASAEPKGTESSISETHAPSEVRPKRPEELGAPLEERPAPAPAPSSEWYGAPTLLGAGLGGAVIGGSVVASWGGNRVSPAAWVPALGAYLLTGPIVHAANGEAQRGLGSVAMGVAFPAMAVVVASVSLFFEGDCDFGLPHSGGAPCPHTFGNVILVSSFLAGPIIDGLLVSRHFVRRPAPTTEARSVAPFVVTPTFVPIVAERSAMSGFEAGIAGRF